MIGEVNKLLLYIDGIQWDGEGDPLKGIIERDRVISKVSIDGEEYKGPFEEALKVTGADEIKIETTSLAQLIAETQATVQNYLTKLMEGIKQVACLFQSGQEAEACTLSADIIAGLDWLVQAVIAINNLKQDYLPDIEIHTFLDKTKELLKAWESKDFILISDLFEYEFLPLLERWGTLIKRSSLVG